MDDAEIIKILLKFQEYLSLTSIWTAPLRIIGWFIILGLAACVDGLSGGINEVYKLINFFDSDQVNDIITRFMPVIFSLSSLAIAFLGWKIIVQKKTEYNKIVSSSLFAVTLFLVLPWGMQQASNLLTTSKDALDEDGKISVSTKIFQNNIIDVYKIDKADWSQKQLNKIKRPNNIESDTDVALLDITESVDTGGLWHSSPLSEDGQKILKKKVSDASGEKKLEDLQSRWIQEDEAYYRYAWHPWYMMFELVTIGIVLFMTMFRTVQMIMELGILKIFSIGTTLTDLESGQRNKRFLEKIRNTFIVMFAILLLLQCYILFTDFVGKSDLSGPTKIVALIAAGILTIDGPAFIDEMFGIDAGMKSIGRSLVGLFAGAKTAQMGANLAKNTVGKTAKGLGNIGKRVGGGVVAAAGGSKGVLDGFKEKTKGAKTSSNGKTSGKTPSSPLSKALEGQPTNVLSNEALKGAMMPADGQNGKKPGPSAKDSSGNSSLSKMSTDQAKQNDNEKENTPLSSMPGQSGGGQGTAGDRAAAGNGETPLSSMPGQSGGGQGTAGDRAAAGNGETPLSSMPGQSGGQGTAGDHAAAGNGGTLLSPTPGQSGGGQVVTGGRVAGNGGTPLSPTPRQLGGGQGSTSVNTAGGTSFVPISSPNGGPGVISTRATSGNGSSSFTPTPGHSKGVLPSHGTSISRALPSNNYSVNYGGSGRFDYTPRVSGSVNSKPIIMPKHVQNANTKLKDHMVRRPTTQLTAKDMMVSKYANLAQKIYDSSTVTGARKAYDVAKNTVTGGYKGEDK
ncbi:hypothetical protein MOB49_12030 [Bacillus haynesii]|uniref:pLS20_p028 family conjugation system transmembrane protein n=1 Tax=Bacillus haynesii TaxID=1925021 RepID=UPI00227E1D72|nr:hypothetical protein [Bacillus haynesii]MCY7967820.1 hypothetical protein [Bacillus haynesii]